MADEGAVRKQAPTNIAAEFEIVFRLYDEITQNQAVR